jgi:uncharacterized protein
MPPRPIVPIPNIFIMKNSDTDALPPFDSVVDAFHSLGALSSPAELHGMLCGRLCGGSRCSEQEWLKSALEFLDGASPADSEVEEMIVRLYRISLGQLHSEQLSLQLLLPGDEIAMAQRLTALSQWCQGFLVGFGTSGINDKTLLSGETADALRDFAAFVQISPKSGEDEDEAEKEANEKDYLEIVEYVRLATLSIYWEIGMKTGMEGGRGASEAPVGSPTFH